VPGFSLLHSIHTGFGIHAVSHPVGTGSCSAERKTAGVGS
jgi:hypothetical protein